MPLVVLGYLAAVLIAATISGDALATVAIFGIIALLFTAASLDD